MGRTSIPTRAPLRPSEAKNNWEGGCRRWSAGQAEFAGTILNDMMSHEDWVPTLMSAAGRPTVTDELKAGVNINGRATTTTSTGTISPYLTEVNRGPRNSFYYWSDDGH